MSIEFLGFIKGCSKFHVQMELAHPKHEELQTDLESGTGIIHTTEDRSLEQKDFTKLHHQFLCIDNNLVNLSIIDPLTTNNSCPENILKVVIDSQTETEGKKMNIGKETRKKASTAKKPPRPPRGFSLDAADQKLIKELAELALMKRARVKRMKALKQKKLALKASSPSSSSSMSGSLFATIFTIIFFLMILLQGTSYRSPVAGSPQTNENGLVFVQEQLNPSATDSILPHSKSSILYEKIGGSDSAE